MRFSEIGQQLRAYRLESGLRAEEIAAKLGVSRAALYRYEKGDVIKLDTIQRLAEMLKISPLSLLGIGVEYYNRPVAYFERVRQLEETSDQVLSSDGPFCYLTTSDGFDAALGQAFEDVVQTPSRDAATAGVSAVQGLLAARKRSFGERRPSIIAIFPAHRLRQALQQGVAGALPVSDRVRRICRDAAASEAMRIADIMDAEPMGLQFGLLTATEPVGGFEILRSRDRASLAINPFRADAHPDGPSGVAMVTSADEAVAAHQRVAEAQWRESLKGPAAAARVREMVAAHTA